MRRVRKPYKLNYHSSINLLTIDTCIGGVRKGHYFRAKLLVDTGASFTMIQPEVFQFLGYDLGKPVKYEQFQGIAGKTIVVLNDSL